MAVAIGYIKDVLDDYKTVTSMMDDVIEESGYEISYLAKYLNISRSAFYTKRKKKTFTFEEMEKIVSLLNSEEEEDDDIQLIKELDEMKKTNRILSKDEFDKMLGRK
jgi:predicted transcriptional regulator